MTDEFLTVFRILRINGDGPNDLFGTNEELIEGMREDEEALREEQSFVEHVLRHANRPVAEHLLRLLHSTTRYVSNLIDADVPILISREDVRAAAGLAGTQDTDALRLGRALHRAVERHVADQADRQEEHLLAKIESLFTASAAKFIPPPDRYLDTGAIAIRLQLAPKTVRRLCNQGKIDADKTAGREWRTTAERLRNSPYLTRNRGRDGA